MDEPVCYDGCEAYRIFGTPDDFALDGFEDDLHEMSFGITAWRTIAFALARGMELPLWVKSYLKHTAAGIDDWAALNGHPGDLKRILGLNGKRKFDDVYNEPRWIYDAISQLREQQPKASVAALVRDYMKQFPRTAPDEENVRQKYYQGKKLAETGEDYKGRSRKREIGGRPWVVSTGTPHDDLDF